MELAMMKFGVMLVLVLVGQTCQVSAASRYTAEEIINDVQLPEEMLNHAQGFFTDPQIVQINDRIQVAMGYALANSIIIDAPEGLIIVDTTESMEAAQRIYRDLRQITKRPVKAIIYTHNHGDHICGAKAFVDDLNNPPEIWGHFKLEEEFDKFTATSMTLLPRAFRQFGILLPKLINSGLGRRVEYNYNKTVGILMPTHLVYNDTDVTIAGLPVRIVPIPGETDDQIGIWIPEDKAFLSADDIYKAFPNLYAIRGTPVRNVLDWIRSVDKIRYMMPDLLVPSHGQAHYGREQIYDLLTTYRDGIQYVHDQTIRFLNKGLHPVDIALKVKLPPVLAEFPYLAEMYGTVEWSVRNIVNQYVGWFSGDVAELAAIGTKEKAERMVDLVGREKLVEEAARALAKGEDRWALELVSYVFTIYPDDENALDVRLEALKSLARAHTSTNGRNYYLTTALEDQHLVKNAVNAQARTNFIEQMSLSQLFTALQTRLAAERVEGIHDVVVFHFSDVNETYTATLRRGVLEVTKGEASDCSMKVTLPTTTWRNVLAGSMSRADAYFNGDIHIEKGGLMAIKKYFAYFDDLMTPSELNI